MNHILILRKKQNWDPEYIFWSQFYKQILHLRYSSSPIIGIKLFFFLFNKFISTKKPCLGPQIAELGESLWRLPRPITLT